jgi:hypothetical protein
MQRSDHGKDTRGDVRLYAAYGSFNLPKPLCFQTRTLAARPGYSIDASQSCAVHEGIPRLPWHEVWNISPLPIIALKLIESSLASAEIYQILAVLFRNGGPKFELYETDESDVKLVHDFVTPMPRLDSKGLRIIFN